MTTATKKDPPTIPADTEQVISLTAATYHRDSHRQADASRGGYLRHLLALGYTPAETDRLVMGEQTLPTIPDDSDRPASEPR